MSDRGAIAYVYDGSFDGLLCCVFDSYDRHETLDDILPENALQGTLYPIRRVDTDRSHAQRVYQSILRKMGREADELVRTVFLHGEPGKEMVIYRFLRIGFRQGLLAVQMLQNPDVNRLHKLARAVMNEQHLLREFLRFSDFDGALVATIAPKHFVLPLLGPHFCDRFLEEHFLIYDKTHGMALVYQPYQSQIIAIDSLETPPADETELQFRKLWKQYYHTIGIEARYNPRCRMSHMPKHFWEHMTEMLPEEAAPRRTIQEVEKLTALPLESSEPPSA